MTAFEYYILYWDSFDNKNRSAKGIVVADTFVEAVDKLKVYYIGDEPDNLLKIHIDAIDFEDGVAEFTGKEAEPGERNKA